MCCKEHCCGYQVRSQSLGHTIAEGELTVLCFCRFDLFAVIIVQLSCRLTEAQYVSSFMTSFVYSNVS